MKTIFEQGLRSGLETRLARITADSRPAWGKMNVEQMTAHLRESLRMARGDFHVKPRKLPIRFWPLRELVVYWLPWPKGSPTADELLPAASGTVEANKAEIASLLGELGTWGDRKDWPDHPAFGKLGRRGWGVMIWRHIDHHLRQFGV